MTFGLGGDVDRHHKPEGTVVTATATDGIGIAQTHAPRQAFTQMPVRQPP